MAALLRRINKEKSRTRYTLSHRSAETRFDADHEKTVSKNSSRCENAVAPAQLGDEGSNAPGNRNGKRDQI